MKQFVDNGVIVNPDLKQKLAWEDWAKFYVYLHDHFVKPYRQSNDELYELIQYVSYTTLFLPENQWRAQLGEDILKDVLGRWSYMDVLFRGLRGGGGMIAHENVGHIVKGFTYALSEFYLYSNAEPLHDFAAAFAAKRNLLPPTIAVNGGRPAYDENKWMARRASELKIIPKYQRGGGSQADWKKIAKVIMGETNRVGVQHSEYDIMCKVHEFLSGIPEAERPRHISREYDKLIGSKIKLLP